MITPTEETIFIFNEILKWKKLVELMKDIPFILFGDVHLVQFKAIFEFCVSLLL